MVVVDQFAIVSGVLKAWLPVEEEVEDDFKNILRALSRAHVLRGKETTGRLTSGLIIATDDVCYHSLNADPIRSSNRTFKRLRSKDEDGPCLEEVIGDASIENPLVVVKLAKSGLTRRDFQPSYGDILRINEAGNPCVVVDLSKVRLITSLDWRAKPSGTWLRRAKEALVAQQMGGPKALEKLSKPPFNNAIEGVLKFIGSVTDSEISYGVNLSIARSGK